MQFVEERATVSHVEDGYVYLETKNSASCNNCLSKSGCGRISSIFSLRPRNKLKVLNTLKLKQGDMVILGMTSDRLLKATLLMYFFPLILLFSSSLIAKLLVGEIVSIISGLSGFFVGLLILKQYAQRKIIVDQFQPKLIRKIIAVDSDQYLSQ